MGQYYVLVRDTEGAELAVIDNYVSLSFQHKLNSVGQFSLELIDERDANGVLLTSEDKISLFELDGIVEFWRSDAMAQLGWYREFAGLYRKMTPSISSDGKRTVLLEGFCPNHLLSRRVIAYNTGTIKADKDDTADQVVYEYIDENCGQNATVANGRYCDPEYGQVPGDEVDADGVMPEFYVDAPDAYDFGDGNVVDWRGSKSFENLLDVLQEIAEFANIDFVVQHSIDASGITVYHCEIHTNWIGTDRTEDSIDGDIEPVTFSVGLGTLQDASRTYDRSQEATVVFVLGGGDMSTRSVLPVENTTQIAASPYNRIEVARGASDNEFVYQLRDYGKAALEEMAYKDEISAKVMQQSVLSYAKHYFLGDHVQIRFRDTLMEYRITGINISYASSGEESIEVVFERRKSTKPGIESDL